SPAHIPHQGYHKTRHFGQVARGFLHRKDGPHQQVDATAFSSAQRAPAPPSPAAAPARAQELTLKRTPSMSPRAARAGLNRDAADRTTQDGCSVSPAQPMWPTPLGDCKLSWPARPGFQCHRQPFLPYTVAAPPPDGCALQAESTAQQH
ncbi:hypothetical protein E2320_003498, partial [Naja naja]